MGVILGIHQTSGRHDHLLHFSDNEHEYIIHISCSSRSTTSAPSCECAMHDDDDDEERFSSEPPLDSEPLASGTATAKCKPQTAETVSVDHRALRSCDTCYALKEKCSYPTPDADCYRCSRLKKPCTSERPLRAAGRPRKSRPVKCGRSKPAQRTPSPRLPIQLRPCGSTEQPLGTADNFLLYSILNASHVGNLVSQTSHTEPRTSYRTVPETPSDV